MATPNSMPGLESERGSPANPFCRECFTTGECRIILLGNVALTARTACSCPGVAIESQVPVPCIPKANGNKLWGRLADEDRTRSEVKGLVKHCYASCRAYLNAISLMTVDYKLSSKELEEMANGPSW
jgi:hypothetical protein